MRRALAVISITSLLGLAACSSGSSGGSGSGDTSNPTTATTPGGAAGNSITDPINRARDVVGQQNSQLQQEEQRTGYEDPTSP